MVVDLPKYKRAIKFETYLSNIFYELDDFQVSGYPAIRDCKADERGNESTRPFLLMTR